MAQEKIADILAYTGLILGVVGGTMAYESAMFINPQGEFTENPERVFFVVCLWFFSISMPFLLIRHFFLLRNRTLLGLLVFSFVLSILLSALWEVGNYRGVFFSCFIIVYGFLHSLALFWDTIKKYRT